MSEITLTYETACARIEEIIRRLDSGEAGLRETLELCQEGRRLVEFCAGELEAVGRGLEELQLDELVARLEAGRADAGRQQRAQPPRSAPAGGVDVVARHQLRQSVASEVPGGVDVAGATCRRRP